MKKTFIILRSVVLAVTGSKCDLMFAVVLLEENSSTDHFKVSVLKFSL